MGKLNHKIRVKNDGPVFTILWLEPWGEDYGMCPEDEFEIIAAEAEESFYFHVSWDDKDIFVYAEGDPNASPTIYQNGEQLECGHNRRAS